MISVYYVEDYNFSDENGIVRYKDKSKNIESMYDGVEECSWKYGDEDEDVLYIKTYTLVNNNGDKTKFIVRSDNKNYRALSSVVIKTPKGFAASQIF
jgi:hypothetical protein